MSQSIKFHVPGYDPNKFTEALVKVGTHEPFANYSTIENQEPTEISLKFEAEMDRLVKFLYQFPIEEQDEKFRQILADMQKQAEKGE